ncbi:MAG: OmpA family protein [Nitrospirales bacterium]
MWYRSICLVSALGLSLAAGSGCASKSLQVDAGSESVEGGMAGAAGTEGSRSGMGQPGPGVTEQNLAGGRPGMGGSGLEEGQFGVTEEALPPIGMGPSGAGDEPLGGLNPVSPGQDPQEEHLGSGFMVAKVDPSGDSGEQERLEDMQRDQLASASAALKDVFFGFDSWRLTEEGKERLTEAAQWLRTNPDKTLTIEGHCDQRGTLSYNFVLGEKRAKAIQDYLVELGVNARQLRVVSYGKERPFCTSETESCYQQNRRGHLDVSSR